jgi:hypothetical protein
MTRSLFPWERSDWAGIRWDAWASAHHVGTRAKVELRQPKRRWEAHASRNPVSARS